MTTWLCIPAGTGWPMRVKPGRPLPVTGVMVEAKTAAEAAKLAFGGHGARVFNVARGKIIDNT